MLGRFSERCEVKPLDFLGVFKKNNFFQIWVFPKIGIPQNGWFIMENPIKWMIRRYPYFRKHPYIHNQLWQKTGFLFADLHRWCLQQLGWPLTTSSWLGLPSQIHRRVDEAIWVDGMMQKM